MSLVRSVVLWFAPQVMIGAATQSALPAQWSDGTQVRKQDSGVLAADFRSPVERRWSGGAIWCNRLQDWFVRDGRLFCSAEANAPCRTAHLLTYELSGSGAPFALRVTLALAADSPRAGFAGFLLGAGQGRLDYRGAALVHHFPGKGGGVLAVMDLSSGRLAFRDMSAETNAANYPTLPGQREVAAPGRVPEKGVLLGVEGKPSGSKYTLRLSAWDPQSGDLVAATELPEADAAQLRGNVALASHNGGRQAVHSFLGLYADGEGLAHHPDRTYGPIAGTLYTVSNNVLKLSAQFFPLANRVSLRPAGGQRTRRGDGTARLAAHLEMKAGDGTWKRIDGPKAISGPDFYVPFRVEKWDAGRDAETRVVFEDLNGKVYHYATRVARNPIDKPTVSVAGFTGMGAVGRTAGQAGPEPGEGLVVVGRWTPANVWAPFANAVAALKRQNLDMLVFTGDQIYEGKPSAADPSFDPAEDYLYKWLLWHWSFRDLTNHLPAVVQPDDHDVYQGNLWGWGGRLNLTGHNSGGGYLCSPYFVNMVHRTQTGHLPDAYDPLPILNGITNYYTRFTWGGVGFAVLEDRKFKTPGQVQDPAQQVLLGEGQHRMLREWAAEWQGQEVKCVISQTIYASMHVGFDGKISGDHDTGGFPKIRRDEALDLFRRAGTFVLGGDQHLATFARLGVRKPSDAVYQFAVPAMGNIFWRWFYPKDAGMGKQAGEPDYTGEFVDGHGNHFRMMAVANPERRSLLGQQLRQRYLIPLDEARRGLGDEIRASQGDGYGIVRFNKQARTVTAECWPHDAEPGSGKQFEGWPITVNFEDLDGRQPMAWLPDIEFDVARNPVVQIVDERSGEIVRTTRVRGGSYSPGVFDPGAVYTLRVGVPETGGGWYQRTGLKAAERRGAARLRVMIPSGSR